MQIAILVFSILSFLNTTFFMVGFVWTIIDDLKKSKEKRAAYLAALKNKSDSGEQ